jgi:predicted RNA binding protein YcfA (HicA-like mRNA interferase family)
MSRINNLRPEKAAKFLVKNGWRFINRAGSHETYFKTEPDGTIKSCQVIYNNSTIYWKNAKEMIKRSGMSEEEWIKGCK